MRSWFGFPTSLPRLQFKYQLLVNNTCLSSGPFLLLLCKESRAPSISSFSLPLCCNWLNNYRTKWNPMAQPVLSKTMLLLLLLFCIYYVYIYFVSIDALLVQCFRLKDVWLARGFTSKTRSDLRKRSVASVAKSDSSDERWTIKSWCNWFNAPLAAPPLDNLTRDFSTQC